MIITKHPIKNIELNFNPSNHSYIDNLNNNYLSITTYIADHFEKFDSDKIATRCAIKRNVTKESLLKEWKEKGDIAANQGEIVHSLLANRFQNKSVSYDNEVAINYRNQVNAIYENVSKQLDVVYIEKIIFDPDKLIAGTCDSVFITKKKDKYVVIDWKTSKQIDMRNNYNKFGLYPFHKLMDCNYNHYSIQLNMYSDMLKTQGYLDLDIPIVKKIVHVLPNKSVSLDVSTILM